MLIISASNVSTTKEKSQSLVVAKLERRTLLGKKTFPWEEIADAVIMVVGFSGLIGLVGKKKLEMQKGQGFLSVYNRIFHKRAVVTTLPLSNLKHFNPDRLLLTICNRIANITEQQPADGTMEHESRLAGEKQSGYVDSEGAV